MGILQEILLPYQLKWVEDRSRFKIGCWSRQTGKSFTTSCEAVLGAHMHHDLWVTMSAGERQAIEWLEKAKRWCKAYQVAMDSEVRINDRNPMMTKGEIRMHDGGRIIAIPANPDTARGYSANLVLDEFAIHEKPADIWAAIYPSITNPLSGEKVLRIVSTPRGRGNKFADLWEMNDQYSKHKVTIEDAVRSGLRVNIEELRKGVSDPDIWAQEFMCEFIDSSAVLLPYEMLGKCESDRIADPGDVPLYIGMDIGRSHDLSVIVTLARIGDVLHTVGVDVLSRMPFRDQLCILVGKARAGRVQRVCIDSTGIGAMLAEEARAELGSIVEQVQFTSTSKGEMYEEMRRKFEDKTIRIPVNRELREDLHAVQKIASTGGRISYSAPRSSDGHSDRASAMALAIRAATSAGVQPVPVAFPGVWSVDPDERTL